MLSSALLFTQQQASALQTSMRESSRKHKELSTSTISQLERIFWWVEQPTMLITARSSYGNARVTTSKHSKNYS